MKVKPVLAFIALLALGISNCKGYIGKTDSTLIVSADFQNKNALSTLALDPRARCIEIKVIDSGGSVAGSAVLVPSSPTARLGLSQGSYFLEVKITDGQPDGNSCTGSPLDFTKASASIVSGLNTLEITMPRGKWRFNSTITFNSTLAGSTESVNGFYVVSGIERSDTKNYDFLQVLFTGANLPQLNCSYGTYCTTRIEVSTVFVGPDSTKTLIGSELTGLEQDFNGWIRLAPGLKGPRYFGIVSAPPCTYKKPGNLIDCTYSVSDQSLINYMNSYISSNGSIQGYLWEIHIDSANTTRSISCYSDSSMTTPVTCPSELLSDPQSLEKQNTNTSPTLRINQFLFSNVQLNINKKYKYSSPDGNTYWVSDDRRLVFDVAVHPFSASKKSIDLNLILSNLFYLTYDSSFNISGIFPVSYNLTKATNILPGPLTTSIDPVLIPHFAGVNQYFKTYVGHYPKDLIYFNGTSFYKVTAYAPASPVQISSYTTPLLPALFCNFRTVYDPVTGTAHIFIAESSTGDCTVNSIDTFYYINSQMLSTDPPTTISALFPVRSLVDKNGVLFHMQNSTISHFIGNDYQGNIYICPVGFTLACTTQAFTTSSFFGFSYKGQLSTFHIDGTLWYFDGTNLTNSNIPVDLCAIDDDGLYCYWSDTNNLKTEIFKFDYITKTKKPLGTMQNYFDPIFNPLISLTENYILMSAYDNLKNKWLIEVMDKKTGSSSIVNLPQGMNPNFNYPSSEYAFYSVDFVSGDFCYLSDKTIPNIKCMSNSNFVGIILKENGPLTEHLGAIPYFKDIGKILVQENCTRAAQDSPCTGGSLFAYSPDMTGKTKVMDLQNDEFIIGTSGYGDVILIHTSSNQTGFEKIYAANVVNGSSVLIDSGGKYSLIYQVDMK